MPLKTQAATEIAQFLANHPTPDQIVAFHPSSEVAERAYELIYTDRDGSLTEEERNRGERLINGLKQFRRIATLYEKRVAEPLRFVRVPLSEKS